MQALVGYLEVIAIAGFVGAVVWLLAFLTLKKENQDD